MCRHRHTAFFVLAFLAAFMAALAHETRAAAAQSWEICARAAAQAEALRPDLPPHLLLAVAKVESGRWHRDAGARFAWPWTVNAGGKGQFLPSKEAAIAKVRRLRAEGRRNIDVGCMQVNLHFHGHAFDSLEEAFDPASNVAYAAGLLLHLREKAGSWTRAIGDYHSRTPRYSGPYRLRVFRAWREERRAAQAAEVKARRNQAAFARNLENYLRDDKLL